MYRIQAATYRDSDVTDAKFILTGIPLPMPFLNALKTILNSLLTQSLELSALQIIPHIPLYYNITYETFDTTCLQPKNHFLFSPQCMNLTSNQPSRVLKHSLQMKIRSGGHDYEGISYWSEVPFFILDMFNLRSIKVNIEDETAWVQAGATVGEMLYKIAEKSNTHGFPVGVCPTMGVGGHLSGGGYGYLMRKYGLSVNNIVDAQLIDVNGRVLNRETIGKDFFWAITGGGASSFGVVLAYKIKLVRVPAKVTVFDVHRTLEQNATEIVYRYQHVAHKLPKEIFIRLTMMVMNITEGNKMTINASFMSLFLGDSETLVSLMNKRFPELGLKKKDCKEMSFVQSYIKWTNYALGTNCDIGAPKVLLNRAYNSTHLTRWHSSKSRYRVT
ncbi:hypothetical protein TEA_024207 [Camellia sinensis var. sinensis]|uniref:FAD-binding PCMH-type domain-containing protein n=1 Tax=Camellia sinensis var. sinensis TaxID=542762 RepID=A0A4S4DXM2_CAMSN|nr:hypothetical protein TEA_024207 [Camellia sinensis var. sinensis]